MCAGGNVSVRLAILTALAGRPGRRATFDDIRRDVATIVARRDQTAQAERFARLGDVDIFWSGLVLRDDTGLQITDAGLSLLRWLESPTASEPLPPTSAAAAPCESIDDLVGAETRRAFFDLELRPQQQDDEAESRTVPSAGDRGADVQVAAIDASGQRDAAGPVPPPDALAIHDWQQALRRSAGVIADKARALIARCLAVVTAAAPPRRSLLQSIGGAAIALLGAMVIVACLVAAIAYSQIENLRSEIVALRRELVPAKERIARLELIEKAKRDVASDGSAPARLGAARNRILADARMEASELALSHEEAQVIREYIKPAPAAGSAATPVVVGDPVSFATIQLPAPLTERLPKLVGARFTIHNGAIIIVQRGSRHADAVLAPN